jgi:hypothetical protein
MEKDKKDKSVISMLNNVLKAKGSQEKAQEIPQEVHKNAQDEQDDKPKDKNVFDMLGGVLGKKEEQAKIPDEVREAVKKKIDKGKIKMLLKDFLK